MVSRLRIIWKRTRTYARMSVYSSRTRLPPFAAAVDGDGTMDAHELRVAMDKSGFTKITDKELETMASIVDENDSVRASIL